MTECPACRRRSDEPFAELRGVPLHPNVLWESAEEARGAPRADVALSLCASCGLIWNVRFDPDALAYEEEYENSLHFSPAFQHYSEALADRLIDRYRLEGRHAVEIGCGKGEFLALLCERGWCSGLGFDPSYAGEADHRADGRLTFVREVVTETTDLGQPDLVVCRHVLEHLADPVGMLTSLRAALGQRDTALYLEVPSAEYMLRETAIWDVIYPHVTCWSAQTLSLLLERVGFHVREHGYSFGDEYLWIEASTTHIPGAPASQANGDVARLVEGFSARAAAKRQTWADRLPALLAEKPVALWGAGAKGVTFLNVVPDGGRIEAVVDVNPRKHGKYMPGAGQVIEHPEILARLEPGTVVVMNAAYRNEIGDALAGLGVDAVVAVA